MHRLRLHRDMKQTRRHSSKAMRIRFPSLNLCVCVKGVEGLFSEAYHIFFVLPLEG